MFVGPFQKFSKLGKQLVLELNLRELFFLDVDHPLFLLVVTVFAELLDCPPRFPTRTSGVVHDVLLGTLVPLPRGSPELLLLDTLILTDVRNNHVQSPVPLDHVRDLQICSSTLDVRLDHDLPRVQEGLGVTLVGSIVNRTLNFSPSSALPSPTNRCFVRAAIRF